MIRVLIRTVFWLVRAVFRSRDDLVLENPEEFVPLSNPGLPALSGDGRQVALFIT